MNDSVIGCSCIGHFRSPDDWVSARIVLRRIPDGTHHADAVGLDDRVPADTAPNLRVVFEGIPISGCSQR
jgi:hypothetical protein